jgi:hypothetical protein
MRKIVTDISDGVGEDVPAREVGVLVDWGMRGVDEMLVAIKGGIVSEAAFVVAIGWVSVGESSFGVADLKCVTTGLFSIGG